MLIAAFLFYHQWTPMVAWKPRISCFCNFDLDCLDASLAFGGKVLDQNELKGEFGFGQSRRLLHVIGRDGDAHYFDMRLLLKGIKLRRNGLGNEIIGLQKVVQIHSAGSGAGGILVVVAALIMWIGDDFEFLVVGPTSNETVGGSCAQQCE